MDQDNYQNENVSHLHDTLHLPILAPIEIMKPPRSIDKHESDSPR
jgi:hypothetical protein